MILILQPYIKLKFNTDNATEVRKLVTKIVFISCKTFVIAFY